MRAVPGGPFDKEKKIPDAIKRNLEKKYHLDEPLIKQYFRYITDVFFRFDFGPSFKDRARNVNEIIGSQLPVSLAIGFWALLIAFVFGVIFGVISALNHNKFWDYFFTSIAVFGISTPLFVIAPVLIILIARTLGLVPVAGWGKTSNYIIPVLSLSLPYLSYITRLMKTGMLEVLRKDYIRTARAKGLSETTIIFKHALKGAIIPVVTFLGPAFAGVVTGSMVIEQICSIPGMGRSFVLAAFNRDYTLVAGVMITYALILMIMNFLVDIFYAVLDPRVKLN